MTNNQKLIDWVNEWKELCQPDEVYWVDGSEEENQRLNNLMVEKGMAVTKGDVIATVGETGSLIGPCLYFEIRHHGRPLDPLEWISES